MNAFLISIDVKIFSQLIPNMAVIYILENKEFSFL